MRTMMLHLSVVAWLGGAVVCPAANSDIILAGHGWSLARLADGEKAFSNRNYVWQGVPEKFRGWQVTQTAGGERAEIRVKAKRNTMLFAATVAAKQAGIDLAGWNAAANAAFHYSDKNKTPMTVYCRALKAGQEIAVPQGNWAGMMVLLPPDGANIAALVASAQPLERLKHNNPGLVVDLGVGLWAWPLPMDFDGDGDLDLVVNCPDKPYNGVYLFENASGDTAKNKMPVFKPAKRISKGLQNVQVSYVDGKPLVMSPAMEYPDFLKTGLENGVKLPLPPNIHPNKVRANMWRQVDYDGDGKLDIIVGVGDWTEYGWDNAYTPSGTWTNGPLRGFVYWLRNTAGSCRGNEAERASSATNPPPHVGGYEAPVKVMAGGKPVEVFGWPSPNFADFDGDGDLDLLCGEFLDGFTYFENIGTRTAPKYAPGRRLTLPADAKGVPAAWLAAREAAKLPGKPRPLTMDLEMITPTAIDWDKDSDLDLIVGDEDGRVAFIENTGKFTADHTPQFLPPRYFRQEADDVKFGALATPCGFDWDGDGDTDIISGNTAGYIAFFENLSGPGVEKPKWAAPKNLRADGKAIRIMAGPNGSIQGPCEAKWGYTTQTVADWDGDGLPDIIANSILGKVIWFKNVGTRKAPKLAAAHPVEVEWDGPQPTLAYGWLRPKGKELLTQWRTTPVSVDWNKDGLTDLAMLDHEGYLAFFERARRDGKLVLLSPKRVFCDEKGEPLRLNAGIAGRSGRRKLCITDWDGDGKLDILANAANAKFYRQVGAHDGKWLFKDMGLLVEQNIEGHDVSPTVVDFNGDKIPDFLGGAEDGRFYYLRNPRTTAPPDLTKQPGYLRGEFIYETAPFPSCHASTIVEAKDGGVVAAWFGGTHEKHPDVCIWVSRHLGGKWTAPVEVANGVQPDGTRHPTWNPVLFQPRNAPLMLFYKVGPNPEQWWGELKTSDDGGKTWSAARKLPDGFLGPIKNKPVQLPNGDILCPTSTETHERPSKWLVHFERTGDLGKTWQKIGPVNDGVKIQAIQPSVLFLGGDKLLALGRSRQDRVFEVRSDDGGKTWGPMTLGSLPNNNSGTDAVTLKDGRHLIVYNHIGGTPGKWGGKRTPLNVAVSKDARTWHAALVLESDPGEYSYPACIQTSDSLVHITYTWKRQKVKHVVVDPAKLVARPMVNSEWPAAGETKRNPLTNGAEWKNDRPVSLPGAMRPKVESVLIYQPTTEWTYSHHQSITFFKGRFYAIWSNGRQDEDAPGQRVLMASSADFKTWTTPKPLVDSVTEKGVERVLTAAGFHQHDGTLVAYFGNYGPNKETTHLQAVTTTDGEHWSAVREMGVPVNPNHGPQRTASGRLIIAGNISFPYTDDPAGLAGWKMTGIYPKAMAATIKDDPASFWEVAKHQGWSAALCEGSFYQTDDGVLHMPLRNTAKLNARRLWLTESRDNGATWATPVETEFSDTNAKFHFGRLPDGRFYYIGNPVGGGRTPLALSLSRDGVKFDRHFILGETHYESRRKGRWKGGEYGYPHSIIHDGHLYAIVSRQKEAVEVLRVALPELK
ncbi:MAG: exo-alpha-sialidase [Verrucomicrobia bacterium]|nr:exo-alpha-sialidase [Verrucomicrobiota bacterium]